VLVARLRGMSARYWAGGYAVGPLQGYGRVPFPHPGGTRSLLDMSGWWPPGRWWPSARGHVREDLLVLAGLVAFVGGVYVAVVVLPGLIVDRADAPNMLLSVAATAIVAVVERARGTLRGWASRLCGRPRP
jgi:hypothetical protein